MGKIERGKTKKKYGNLKKFQYYNSKNLFFLKLFLNFFSLQFFLFFYILYEIFIVLWAVLLGLDGFCRKREGFPRSGFTNKIYIWYKKPWKKWNEILKNNILWFLKCTAHKEDNLSKIIFMNDIIRNKIIKIWTRNQKFIVCVIWSKQDNFLIWFSKTLDMMTAGLCNQTEWRETKDKRTRKKFFYLNTQIKYWKIL